MEMSELVLEHLRGIRAAVDAVRNDVAEIKIRIGSVEQGIAVLHPVSYTHLDVYKRQSSRCTADR